MVALACRGHAGRAPGCRMHCRRVDGQLVRLDLARLDAQCPAQSFAGRDACRGAAEASAAGATRPALVLRPGLLPDRSRRRAERGRRAAARDPARHTDVPGHPRPPGHPARRRALGGPAAGRLSDLEADQCDPAHGCRRRIWVQHSRACRQRQGGRPPGHRYDRRARRHPHRTADDRGPAAVPHLPGEGHADCYARRSGSRRGPARGRSGLDARGRRSTHPGRDREGRLGASPHNA